MKKHQIDAEYRTYIVPAVDRAARILSLLKAEVREVTIAEIARKTGLHKSSVHRLILTMHHHE